MKKLLIATAASLAIAASLMYAFPAQREEHMPAKEEVWKPEYSVVCYSGSSVIVNGITPPGEVPVTYNGKVTFTDFMKGTVTVVNAPCVITAIEE